MQVSEQPLNSPAVVPPLHQGVHHRKGCIRLALVVGVMQLARRSNGRRNWSTPRGRDYRGRKPAAHHDVPESRSGVRPRRTKTACVAVEFAKSAVHRKKPPQGWERFTGVNITGRLAVPCDYHAALIGDVHERSQSNDRAIADGQCRTRGNVDIPGQLDARVCGQTALPLSVPEMENPIRVRVPRRSLCSFAAGKLGGVDSTDPSDCLRPESPSRPRAAL